MTRPSAPESERVRPAPAEAAPPPAGWWVGVLAATVAGAVARLAGLGHQVLTGDELHAVNGALSRSVSEILTTWTYHGADYSVPLTAFYRTLLDAGVVLDEWILRAPILVAGIATPLVLPLLWRRRIGPAASLAAAWLLALSPMLVLYGRMVRSYGLVVLTANVAVVAFDRWWRTRSRPAGAAYAGLAALSIWLHLGAGPFVLAPLAFGLFGAVRRGRTGTARRELARVAALGLAVGVATAVVLLPALQSLLALRGMHTAGRPPDWETWLDVARLQVGTGSFVLVGVVLALCARGMVVLARRDSDLALLVGFLVVGHVAGLIVLAPNFLHALVVMNRYLLVALPLLLALVALGATAVPRRAPSGPVWLQPAVVSLLLLALVATGPLVSREYRWSSYTHAQPFLNFIHPGDSVPADRVPRFYRELGPGGEPIVEAPWTNVGTHSFNAYQHVHHRPLRVASVDRMLADPRIALRNTIPAQPDRLRSSGARYVVLHHDLRQEERNVTTSELRHAERLERLPQLWQVLRLASGGLDERFRSAWGPPVYSDGSISVWDLAVSSSDGPSASASSR